MNKNNVLSKKQQYFAVGASVALSLLVVWGAVSGATTISTNVVTGGSLEVGTISTLTGAVTIGAGLTVGGSLTVNGPDTNLDTPLSVQGLSTLVGGYISVASSTAVAAFNVGGTAIFNGALLVNGGLKVGAVGTVFNKMVGSYCTIATVGITASTTGYMNCTPATNGLVAANDPVMVMATSSLHRNFIITQASSSAANVIALAIYNSGQDTTVATGINSFSFLIMSGQ